MQNFSVVVDQCRKLVTRYQFNNEPLRILLASISSGLRPTDAFITSTLQKHLFRELKLSDAAVKTPEALRWNPLNKRYAHTGAGMASAKGDDGDAGEDDDMDIDADGDRSQHTTMSTAMSEKFELPTKQNPVIVTIYGQICIAAKSYQSAICKLLSPFSSVRSDTRASIQSISCTHTIMRPRIRWFASVSLSRRSVGLCSGNPTIASI